MSWNCPKCHNEVSDDTAIKCNVCGYRSSLILRTESGNEWETMADIDVNRRIYKRLFPGEEHQYVSHEEGRHPFSLKRQQRRWLLIANPESTLAVKLNDSICTEGETYELQSGDTIMLASKTDTDVQIAPLSVSIGNLD